MAANSVGTLQADFVFASVVFNAARDGKLYRLKVFLNYNSEPENVSLISARTNGSTPLIMACFNGHLDVASFLIKEYNADIEQTGSVVIQNKTVKEAPPLWCAAAAGHLKLVIYLLKHGASVNSVTQSKSTPLRAACLHGHFEVVVYLIEHGADIEIANFEGQTCLMVACQKGFYKVAKYLMECGADVNRKTGKGCTALHYCAESGCVEVLKLLLDSGADFISDSNGKTPLLLAALKNQPNIVKYFIKEFNCSREEKIDALELLGASCIDDFNDIVASLCYWLRALKMRHAVGKHPIIKPQTSSPLSSLMNMTEFRDLHQLDNLKTDPLKARFHALLIRERILGPNLVENHHYIRRVGILYAHDGDFNDCIKLWMYVLNMQQKDQEPVRSNTYESLISFVDLFSYMMTCHSLAINPPYFFSDIFHVFEKAVYDIERAMKVSQNREVIDSQFHSFMKVTLYLVDLMCRFKPQISQSQELKFKNAVHRLVHLNPRDWSGRTLLHIACSNELIRPGKSFPSQYRLCKFPSVAVVDLLLEVGASPETLDSYRNTPLHLVAAIKPLVHAIFSSLLSHGSHLDQYNKEKKTPLQLADHTSLSMLDIHPLQYVNLQCLSAKVIQSLKIPYKGLVHKKLEEFVDVH